MLSDFVIKFCGLAQVRFRPAIVRFFHSCFWEEHEAASIQSSADQQLYPWPRGEVITRTPVPNDQSPILSLQLLELG